MLISYLEERYIINLLIRHKKQQTTIRLQKEQKSCLLLTAGADVKQL